MPIVNISLVPGRTAEQKRALVQEVTRVTVETLSVPLSSVDVLLTEVPRDHWAKSGQLLSER